MKSLNLTDENALKLYPEAPPFFKQVLEDTFTKDFFQPKKITDKIKTFEDACKHLGIDPNNFFTISWYSQGISDEYNSIVNYAKAVIVAKALNEGWYPDWSDENQYKYYPYFRHVKGKGLVYFSYYDWRTVCGCRLPPLLQIGRISGIRRKAIQ